MSLLQAHERVGAAPDVLGEGSQVPIAHLLKGAPANSPRSGPVEHMVLELQKGEPVLGGQGIDSTAVKRDAFGEHLGVAGSLPSHPATRAHILKRRVTPDLKDQPYSGSRRNRRLIRANTFRFPFGPLACKEHDNLSVTTG